MNAFLAGDSSSTVLLSAEWQQVKATPNLWLEFTNSSRKKRTVYVRLDGLVKRKTLDPFSVCGCAAGDCRNIAVRQCGPTRDVVMEIKS